MKIPLYAQAIAAMLLGIVAGLWFPNAFREMAPLSSWIVTAIKWLAIPLLFFVISDTFLKSQFKGNHFAWLLGICLVNGTIAITIALFLSNTFHPGSWMPIQEMSLNKRGLFNAASNLKWDLTLVKLAFTSPMILSILSAILFGSLLTFFRVRIVANHPLLLDNIQSGLDWGLRTLLRMIHWVTYLIPIAIFLTIANLVGKSGFSFAHGLGAYVLVCITGMLLHIFLCYQTWVTLIAKVPFVRFWREAREPVAYAFGVNSSLATLPVTLKALDRLKVSNSSARLSACVGTNFNNDGILLYEVVAVLFLAQAYGIELSLSQQLAAAALSVVATIGVGGVPEAGIISLTLVLSTLHLPQEILPVLLTVDWVVARCRSSTNVLGDMAVAIGLDAVLRTKSHT